MQPLFCMRLEIGLCSGCLERSDSLLVCLFLFLKSMWIERTTFTTVYKLPGILRWFEATDMKHVRKLHCLA